MSHDSPTSWQGWETLDTPSVSVFMYHWFPPLPWVVHELFHILVILDCGHSGQTVVCTHFYFIWYV